MAIPGGTKGVLGDEGVSDLGGGGCHGPFQAQNVHDLQLSIGPGQRRFKPTFT